MSEELQPWQQRVVAEALQLDARIERLRRFRHSPAFKELLPEDQALLDRQFAAMDDYYYALVKRAARFQ